MHEADPHACRDKGTGPVGYVAIQSFGTNTGHDTATALHALKAQGASSYLLDLRGNSGGLVSAGQHVIPLRYNKRWSSKY